jgi:hypothetical protein
MRKQMKLCSFHVVWGRKEMVNDECVIYMEKEENGK